MHKGRGDSLGNTNLHAVYNAMRRNANFKPFKKSKKLFKPHIKANFTNINIFSGRYAILKRIKSLYISNKHRN